MRAEDGVERTYEVTGKLLSEDFWDKGVKGKEPSSAPKASAQAPKAGAAAAPETQTATEAIPIAAETPGPRGRGGLPGPTRRSRSARSGEEGPRPASDAHGHDDGGEAAVTGGVEDAGAVLVAQLEGDLVRLQHARARR